MILNDPLKISSKSVYERNDPLDTTTEQPNNQILIKYFIIYIHNNKKLINNKNKEKVICFSVFLQTDHI